MFTVETTLVCPVPPVTYTGSGAVQLLLFWRVIYTIFLTSIKLCQSINITLNRCLLFHHHRTNRTQQTNNFGSYKQT